MPPIVPKKLTLGENFNTVLTLLSIIIVAVILFFGLRPKVYPVSNHIKWLPKTSALEFRYPSLAYIDDLGSRGEQISGDFTLSVSIAPANLDKQGFRPIVMIHDGDDQRQFSLWQWGSSIVAMTGDDYDYSKKGPRISAIDVLQAGKTAAIVLTSGNSGTCLFVNGRLVTDDKDLKLSIPAGERKMRLVLGNSVYGKHSWQGEIFSLALYSKVLSGEEVAQRFSLKSTAESTTSSQQDKGSDKLLLLYSFDGPGGTIVPDRSGYGHDLRVPDRLVVLKRSFLTSPWDHFTLNRWFVADVVLNLVGFIPLGAVLFLRVLVSKPRSAKRAGSVVLAVCFTLSLSMEIAQAWLPNRTSSILDVILNTFGALAGMVIVFLALYARCAKDS